ncbi:hypothetical protein [Kitasatospora sp. NPDC085879]|uniref:hypothetical protein n=1 Tax=Kitasatospora sp. NPDC085879 TaxID=3154769 RepID=UPI00343C0834
MTTPPPAPGSGRPARRFRLTAAPVRDGVAHEGLLALDRTPGATRPVPAPTGGAAA